MRRLLMCVAAVALFAPLDVPAQQTYSGEPTQADYNAACNKFGANQAARLDCEQDIRIRRGFATCADIEWTYSCASDRMTDATSCTAYADSTNLFVFAEKGKMAFGIIGDSYPGRDSKVRIDKNPAIAFDDDAGTSAAQDALIERSIRNGTRLATRYIRWPTGVPVDQETPVCNLPTVMDEMKARSK